MQLIHKLIMEHVSIFMLINIQYILFFLLTAKEFKIEIHLFCDHHIQLKCIFESSINNESSFLFLNVFIVFHTFMIF